MTTTEKSGADKTPFIERYAIQQAIALARHGQRFRLDDFWGPVCNECCEPVSYVHFDAHVQAGFPANSNGCRAFPYAYSASGDRNG